MRELIICGLFLWTLFVIIALLYVCYLFLVHNSGGKLIMYPLSPCKVRVLKIIESELLKPNVWSYRMGVLKHNTEPFIISAYKSMELNLRIPIDKKLLKKSVIEIENNQISKLIRGIEKL